MKVGARRRTRTRDNLLIFAALLLAISWGAQPDSKNVSACPLSAAMMSSLCKGAEVAGHRLIWDSASAQFVCDGEGYAFGDAKVGRLRSWGAPVPILVLERSEAKRQVETGGDEECTGIPLPAEIVVLIADSPLRVERLAIPCSSCSEQDEEAGGSFGWECESLHDVRLLQTDGTPTVLETVLEDVGGDRSVSGTLTSIYRLLLPGLPQWVQTRYMNVNDPGGNCCAWDNPPVETEEDRLEPWGLACLYDVSTPLRLAGTQDTQWAHALWRRDRYVAFPPEVARGLPKPPDAPAVVPFNPAWTSDSHQPPMPIGDGRWYCTSIAIPWKGRGEVRIGVESTGDTIPEPVLHASLFGPSGAQGPELVVTLDHWRAFAPADYDARSLSQPPSTPNPYESAPPVPQGTTEFWELHSSGSPVTLIGTTPLAATDHLLFTVLHWLVLDSVRYDDLLVLTDRPDGTLALAKCEMLATNLLIPVNSSSFSSSFASRRLTVEGQDEQGTLIEETTYNRVGFSQAEDPPLRPSWDWNYKGPLVLQCQRLVTRITPDGRWIPVKRLPPLDALRGGAKGMEILVAYPSKDPLFTVAWAPTSLDVR